MIKRYEFHGHPFIYLADGLAYNQNKKWFQLRHEIKNHNFYIVAEGLPDKPKTQFNILSGGEIYKILSEPDATTKTKDWLIDIISYNSREAAEQILSKKFDLTFRPNGGEPKK